MKIAIYTSIVAGKDSLKAPQVDEDVDRILFTDRPQDHVDSTWDVRPACNLFTDPRRNSRAHKILAHQYLPEHDYSLWIDGSIRLLTSVRTLVEAHLRSADLAMFPHPNCTCIYDGVKGLADAGYDHRHILEAQAATYRRAGYPANNGLHECGVILRRHSHAVARFNASWWAEYCRHSCRDQVSVKYVERTTGVRIASLPGTIQDNPGIVYYEDHLWR